VLVLTRADVDGRSLLFSELTRLDAAGKRAILPSFKSGLYDLMTQAELEEMRTHGPTIRDNVAALLAGVRTGAAAAEG